MPGFSKMTNSRDCLHIRPALSNDMPAVLEIYNEEVLNSTSTYQYATRTLADQLNLLQEKTREGHAFLVAQTAQDQIVGYASYGLFRPREGWRFTCEHSVYLHKNWRGKGIGLQLLKALTVHAKTQGFRSMVGVIDASNVGSMKMHTAAGFEVMGVFKEAGYKFEHWLDVAFVTIHL